jgi:hypothetical protein
MNLRAGVLAIGSLYWDNNGRERWRMSRLKADVEFSVAVPIRYGRRSSSRRYTYTMVFDPDLQELGWAKAVECRNVVSSASCLIYEAELLWAAERNNRKPDGTLSTSWGCVALLPNPERDIPQQLLNEWARRVSQEHNYAQLARADGSSINDTGMLQIPWPETVDGSLLTLDLLLATTNNPSREGNPPRYPEPDTIAHAWRRASEEYPSERRDDYFWKNKRNGITTFQDESIERILGELGISSPQ